MVAFPVKASRVERRDLGTEATRPDDIVLEE